MKRVFQIVAAAAFLMWRGDASAQIGATSLAAYAGQWRGQIYNDRGDSVRVTWTWVRVPTPSGHSPSPAKPHPSKRES
jgi:hypothetical protein